jgi:hypothetical protein
MWGVYPVCNPYFQESKHDVIYNLSFIMGGCHGVINRKNCDAIKSDINLTNKMDVEKSLLYFQHDGILIRYNKIACKTQMFSSLGGGLGGFDERLEPMKNEAFLIHEKYPSVTRIKIRKNGMHEIVFINPK